MVALHVLSIFFTGLIVLYSDEQGLMWILGKKKTLEKKKVDVLHTLVSIGLPLIILTGGLLMLRAPEYYFANPVFIVKMLFVFVLIVNGLFIGSLTRIAVTQSFASLPFARRLPLLISGGASVLGWGGALLAGFLLGG